MFQGQKGFAHIVVLVLLLVGLGAAVYLVGQQTNFLPKAEMLKIGRFVSQPVSIPTGTRCRLRPACLDARPACRISEPAVGWCPTPKVTPYPTRPVRRLPFF